MMTCTGTAVYWSETLLTGYFWNCDEWNPPDIIRFRYIKYDTIISILNSHMSNPARDKSHAPYPFSHAAATKQTHAGQNEASTITFYFRMISRPAWSCIAGRGGAWHSRACFTCPTGTIDKTAQILYTNNVPVCLTIARANTADIDGIKFCMVHLTGIINKITKIKMQSL